MSIVSLEIFSQALCYQGIPALFPPLCTAVMNFIERPLRNYGHLNGQAIPCLLWNSQVLFCIHKSPPLIPILSSLNSLDTSWFKIHFNIVIPSAVRPLKRMLLLRFSNIDVYVYIFLIFSMHIACTHCTAKIKSLKLSKSETRSGANIHLLS